MTVRTSASGLRGRVIVAGLAGALALLLAVSSASAQEAQEEPTRFRGGIAGDVGGFFLPSLTSALAVGISGQLGAQLTRRWALYAAPRLDFLVLGNDPFAIVFDVALMIDATFDTVPLSLGFGPEIGFYSPILFVGDEPSGAFLIGGRLHAAYYPTLDKGGFEKRPIRRKAVFVGFDLHLDGSTGAGPFAVSPVLSIGYQAF